MPAIQECRRAAVQVAASVRQFDPEGLRQDHRCRSFPAQGWMPVHGIHNHIGYVRQGAQHTLGDGAFIDEALCYRLISINMQRFTGIQCFASARFQSMPDITMPSSTSTSVASSSSLTLTSK